jgi:hypothetical protein
MISNIRRLAVLAAIAVAIQGCALMPDALEPEVIHVSHATQHIVDHTDFGYNEIALAAKWAPNDHLRIEISEGVNVNKYWPSPYGPQYGSFVGPREVFDARIGYEIPLKH